MEQEETKSDFGKGLTYCLGLFLAHAERDLSVYDKFPNGLSHKYEAWFNGASDHLYELVIPEHFPQILKDRLKNFQDKVLEWGHGFKIYPTKEDFNWAISEAKYLLMLIDAEIKIETCLANWS